MPIIREEGEVCRVSSREAAQLAGAGLIAACPCCDEYSHEEYERWDEVLDVLRAIRGSTVIDVRREAQT